MAEMTTLIQFARSAVPGRVKTRLVPPLTTQQAADLHICMVVHTCTVLCNLGQGDVELWLEGDRQERLLEYCKHAGEFSVHQQSRGDLGEKMAFALRAALRHSERAILVGSDTPALDAAYLEAANAALETHDVVLGPAVDGGYVLIGVRRLSSHLFEGVPWSTDSVLDETLQRVEELGWSCVLLSELADIDRPEDLWRLPDSLSFGNPGGDQAETLVP